MVVVTFLLAHVGYDGDVPYLGPELDHLVLAEGLLVSWLVILTSTILGLVLGDGTAWKTVREAEHSETLEVLSDIETSLTELLSSSSRPCKPVKIKAV